LQRLLFLDRFKSLIIYIVYIDKEFETAQQNPQPDRKKKLETTVEKVKKERKSVDAFDGGSAPSLKQQIVDKFSIKELEQVKHQIVERGAGSAPVKQQDNIIRCQCIPVTDEDDSNIVGDSDRADEKVFSDSGRTCVICFDPITTSYPVCTNNHSDFHKDCILRLSSPKCPICREPLLPGVRELLAFSTNMMALEETRANENAPRQSVTCSILGTLRHCCRKKCYLGQLVILALVIYVLRFV